MPILAYTLLLHMLHYAITWLLVGYYDAGVIIMLILRAIYDGWRLAAAAVKALH